jgi:hypothetical protein
LLGAQASAGGDAEPNYRARARWLQYRFCWHQSGGPAAAAQPKHRQPRRSATEARCSYRPRNADALTLLAHAFGVHTVRYHFSSCLAAVVTAAEL